MTAYSKPKAPAFKFQNAEVEKRWQAAAKGIDKPGILQTVKDAVRAEIEKTTRHWKEIPKTPETADLVEKLIQLEQSPNSAQAKLDQILLHIPERHNTRGSQPDYPANGNV